MKDLDQTLLILKFKFIKKSYNITWIQEVFIDSSKVFNIFLKNWKYENTPNTIFDVWILYWQSFSGTI